VDLVEQWENIGTRKETNSEITKGKKLTGERDWKASSRMTKKIRTRNLTATDLVIPVSANV